ncbi:hypothetical protein Tsubulata_008406 [Turnera subulata]|uniref:Rho-GAP domain-containing protein n=1 Tax=Turnera subulata TaxID=218843 RepID=A0A9Q0JMC9_9ROSI|nr:hypothetical protein Tsubulata_008406 [Turnera subulata]
MLSSNKPGDQAMANIHNNNNNNNNNNNSNSKNNTDSDNKNNPNLNSNNNKSKDQSQGDGQPPSPPPLPEPGQLENMPPRDNNTVFKSGPLFISSKGIGWTSWKKRWFILTRTSLVFFRSDPNAIQQKGTEVNLILGGIDLNNSGSVVVKAEKKLLTVLFPDGRDGRAFTLKAETSEDLYEWKNALEHALSKAPSATIGMGQNGIFKKDQANAADGFPEQLKDKQPAKASLTSVIGRPVLVALEDADGSPSFLEKALRFIEDYGIKVEGILRQAADVDDVEHRIREYEQGKTEFTADEDAHVIGDCVKYILREMPSPPVPASCCTALLQAFRTDRSNRVNAMQAAICETFPDPNRRLLQRILLMMQEVASNKADTRMSISAVAACMAPLLLRPLLAGDCEIDTNVNVGGDGSIQLLRAAAAANHAQAIVITLMEEYNNIFSEGSMDGLYSDSEEGESEDELVTEDDESYDEDEDYDDDDASQGSEAYTDDDPEQAYSGSCTETGESGEDDISENKARPLFKGYMCLDRDSRSDSISSEADNSVKVEEKALSTFVLSSRPPNDDVESKKDIVDPINTSSAAQTNKPDELLGDASEETSPERLSSRSLSEGTDTAELDGSGQGSKRTTVWGRTSARKNLSMESIDFPIDDEAEIQKLEASKLELQKRIAEEAQVNAALQANLEKRKKALQERRHALEQDVAKLQEQLQREREKRALLEAGLYKSKGPLLITAAVTDEKMREDLEEIHQAEADLANLKQKINDFGLELCQQRDHSKVNDSSQPVLTSGNQGNLNDAGATTTSQLPGRSASKEIIVAGASVENDKKHEPMSSSSKSSAQNQQPALGRKSTSKTGTSHYGRSGTRKEDSSVDGAESENDKRKESTTSPPHNQPHELSRKSSSKSKSYSKKHSLKSEGVSTTSALTKLTTRLNFLKERRTQIANELQNLDKGQGSGQAAAAPPKKGKGSESRQGKGSEVNSAENPETGGRLEGSQALQDQDLGREGEPVPSSEKRKKADGNADGGR